MKYTITLLLACFSFILSDAQATTDSLSYYIQNFQFKKALKFIDTQEETSSLKFQKAMCYRSLGDTKIAILLLEELAHAEPQNIKVKTELASSYERASQWKETSDTYANLMAVDSTNLYFLIKKSEAEINRKNYKQAVKDLNIVLQKDSLSNAMKLLGKVYETVNNLDSASYYYNMAWTADSLDSFSSANLINIFLKQKEYDKALDYSIKAIELTPDNKSLNMLHGYAYYALEDYDNAAAVLESCFMNGDSSLIVNRSLGISFYYRNDNECAYEYLSKAYKQDTTNATVLYNLAVSAREIKDLSTAIKLHSLLLEKLIPSNMQLYLNYRGLAVAYDENGDYAEAVQNYKNALEYATTDQRLDILYPMAYIYENKLSGAIYDKQTALNYYEQYRTGLAGYISYLKRDQSEGSSEIVKEYESQLHVLEAQLEKLRAYVSESKSRPLSDADFFFVLDDLHVEILPRQEDVRVVVIITDFIKADPAYKKWVDMAKSNNKRAVGIFSSR